MAEKSESNKYFDGDKPSLTIRPESSGVKEKSIGTLKFDVDCSDALKGLKALEAKKAIAALKELEELQARVSARGPGDLAEGILKQLDNARSKGASF